MSMFLCSWNPKKLSTYIPICFLKYFLCEHCYDSWNCYSELSCVFVLVAFIHFQVLLSSAKNSFCNNRLVSAASKLQRASYITSEYRTYRRSSIVSGDASRSFPSGDANLHPDPRSYEVVVAATHDMGIGKDGKLPWRLPSDLNFFKKLTLTTSNPGKKNAVVMGRKTWESIPLRYRPLPGRLNVVLTRSGSSDITAAENVVVCGSIPSALELLAEAPYSFSIERVFIIGGGQILR